MNKAVVAGQSEDSRRRKFPPRSDRQIERTDAASQKCVRQKVSKLHGPEPVVGLDRREQREICQRPRYQNTQALSVESNQQPQKAQRDDFHHQEAYAALHSVIALEGKHRTDDDDPWDQKSVLIVRRPKISKGQLPLARLLEQGDELPVVHEGHTDRGLPELAEE